MSNNQNGGCKSIVNLYNINKIQYLQWCKEGKPWLVMYYLIGILPPPPTIVSNVLKRVGTYPLMFIGMVFNYGLTLS